MKKFILIAVLALSQIASATVYHELIENMSEAEFTSVHSSMESLVKAKVRMQNLREFYIEWNSARCTEVQNEMDDTKLLGTCVIKFSAFQVQGEASVTFKDDGQSVSVIYANVE